LMLLMTVAMPVWRTQARREKEAELIFRGEQYARAVNLYTRKMGPGNFPPTIDVLVQQRFLRKKYKDPMTEDGEFEVITAAGAAGQQGPGGRANPPQSGRGNPGPSTGLSAPPSGRPSPTATGQASPFGGGQAGGVMGVRSKSKETSLRIYNGGTHYNEWSFLFANVSNRPGAPGGQGRPGGPGGMNPGGGRGPGTGAGRPDGRGSDPARGGFGPGSGFGRRGRG
jgi:hypothetical protein